MTLILKLGKDHDFNARWDEWKKKALDYAKLEAPRRSSIGIIYNEYSSASASPISEGIVVVFVLNMCVLMEMESEVGNISGGDAR